MSLQRRVRDPRMTRICDLRFWNLVWVQRYLQPENAVLQCNAALTFKSKFDVEKRFR